MRTPVKIASVLAATALLAACSDASAEPDDGSAPEAGAFEVSGVDYGFIAPDTVPAGSTLTFRNDSPVEYHEMAVLRVTDGEARTVQELLELPEDEAMASFEFVGVAAAMPESDGEVLQGGLTLEAPGRYVLTCFVPEGADPKVVHEAFHATEDGPPPDLGDGVPHAFLGMVRELTVE